MLALKEIQHLFQGEKHIRTLLVQGFVCNYWFSHDCNTSFNECEPWGNSGVGAMGHTCNHPWCLGVQRALLVLYCSDSAPFTQMRALCDFRLVCSMAALPLLNLLFLTSSSFITFFKNYTPP